MIGRRWPSSSSQSSWHRLVSGRRGPFFSIGERQAPAYPEDTVETEWSRKAGFGAFTDLITAMGIALIAHNVFGAPELPLVMFTALGLADFGIRYWAVSRDRTPHSRSDEI